MYLLLVRRIVVATLLALGVPLVAKPLMAQSGTITGKVTDAGTGRAIENAQVQAQLVGGQSYGAISTADGSFRVVNIPDGVYTVTVRALGYDQRSFAKQRLGANIVATLTVRPTQLNQTVVTSNRNRPEKALDAPAQISVVTSEQIEERPAITITDHLRATPGVDINKGGIAQANIVARGFNNAFSGSLLVLQDYRFAGVPSLRVNVPFLFTGTNEDIDRIEVLLGPASALYGPNSSNGVLHIITKSPFASQGTTVSVDAGERSVVRTGLRHAGKINDKFAYKLSGEYMQGRDWEFTDPAEPATFPSTANVPESRRGSVNERDFDLQRMTGEARLDVRPTEGMEAITTVGYTKVGSGIELTGANGATQIKDWQYLSLQQRFRWNRLFAQAFLNSTDAGNDTSNSGRGTFLLRSGQPIVDQSRVAALQLQHGLDLGSKQSFTYGLDYIWTNPRTGNTINGSNEAIDNVTEYGAYLQSSTKPIKQIELLLAARGDRNNVLEGNFFSPRAALIFKPTENQNVRVTFNRAFSTPGNFNFFLDLLQVQNAGGSGFDVRVRGNPPKQGFTFNRSCGNGSQFADFCMKSPFTGAGFVPTSAAAAFPGFVAGNNAAIRAGLTSQLTAGGLPASVAQSVANAAVGSLSPLRPTDTQLSTRAAFLTSGTVNLTPAQVTPIEALRVAFSNTFEVGYKGVVGNRFRFDMAFWGQERADFAPAAVLTPSVFFGNPQAVGGFIASPIQQAIAPVLAGAGIPASQIATIIGNVVTGLTTTLASAPLGVITFDDPNTPANAVIATYQSTSNIWVRGLDLATDVAASDRVTMDLTFSWQNRNTFPGVDGGNGQPLASNSPSARGSLGMRYRNESNGIGFELRSRYNEAYPVNSGVFATNVAFARGNGTAGATTNPTTGANRCNPAPAGAFCFENVPEAVTFDALISKRFNLGAQKLTWSVNAQNLFDNRVRTFPGVPEIGRLVLTRLQYSF